MANNWTREWPTEPGFYWFYGTWGFLGYDEPLSFFYVEVELIEDIPRYTWGRNTFYNLYDVTGQWQPVTFPEPPESWKVTRSIPWKEGDLLPEDAIRRLRDALRC